MTRTRLSIVAAALVAAVVVTGHAPVQVAGEQPAPFWQLQGAAPSARDSEDLTRLRMASRQSGEIVVAAR